MRLLRFWQTKMNTQVLCSSSALCNAMCNSLTFWIWDFWISRQKKMDISVKGFGFPGDFV